MNRPDHSPSRAAVPPLTPAQITAGYQAVSRLYPHLPSMIVWRAWEYAAFRRYRLPEPVLDIGCGDGRFFRLIWPYAKQVVGVDIDPAVVQQARASGVYSEVHQAAAHDLPVPHGHFGAAFANCSLEHMDRIDEVLASVCRSLRPGGMFACSVVTEKFIEWAPLPDLFARAGEPERARQLQSQYRDYHHLVNPFPAAVWAERLERAGFEVLEHLPILPEQTSRLFLFLDQLWHASADDGALGQDLSRYLQGVPRFPETFSSMAEQVLRLERDMSVGSGAIFVAIRPGEPDEPERHSPAVPGVSLGPDAPVCWCGSREMRDFSPDYLACAACGTLVTRLMPDHDLAHVQDDDSDFYGREYWFSHQEDDLGQANIVQRARADLPERCIHWLRTLLSYKLPPAKVLELGSAHGGFVALLRAAGYDATGLELSPWVIEYARETFDVPMLSGPIEDQQIPPGSLDAIVLMDVLEHLPDPVGTMRACLDLLKPDGILLIQTPNYRPELPYEQLVVDNHPFLIQLKANQHLYLFSAESARELFSRLGAAHVELEPAFFPHYDMFLAVSRTPLGRRDAEQAAEALSATPAGRLALALLDADQGRLLLREQLMAQVQRANDQESLGNDLRCQLEEMHGHLAFTEEDRAARLAVIERQGAELGRLAAVEQRVGELEQRLIASEEDRAARLAVIERQGAELDQLRRRMLLVDQLLALLQPKRMVRPSTWQRINELRDQIESSAAGSDEQHTLALSEYVAQIDSFNANAQHRDLMQRIRAYNHTIIDELNKSRSLEGKRLLDIGASPHGYALERALKHRVAEYVGVGLSMEELVTVRGQAGTGRLLSMNCEQLDFPDASFDLVVSLSTFEHILNVPQALAEIRRVLKPGGSALITFEPIWTCSYGHHLHHFGPVSQLVPPWAHLRWTKQQMQDELAAVWPRDAALTLREAAEWTYDSTEINRVGIVEMRSHFAASGLATEWLVPLPDDPRDPARLHATASATGISPEDLMTKGFTVLLNKPAEPADSQAAPPSGTAPAEQLAAHNGGGRATMPSYLQQIRMTVRLLRHRRAMSVPSAAQPPAASPEVVAQPMVAAAQGVGGYVLSPTEAALAAAEIVPLAPGEPTEQDYYDQIREPKAQKVVAYNEHNLAQITGELRALGFTVQELTVDVQGYRDYFAAANYPPSYYAFNLPEKSLEHYVAAQLLEIGPDDIYIDIASEHSPVPEIYSRLYGCTSYRQDLAYAAGLHGDQIGGDAAAMPVPDGFASKMALHCSFEHFEGDADSRFMRECARVLRPGGRVCFAPIYVFNEFVNQAGAAAAIKGKVEFDEGATVYAKSGWRHRFARYYDPAHLASRVRAHASGLDLTVFLVTNGREVDQSCYIRYVLLASKP